MKNSRVRDAVTVFVLFAMTILLALIFNLYLFADSSDAAGASKGRPIYMCGVDGDPLPCVYSVPDMAGPPRVSYIVHKDGTSTPISHKRAHRLFTYGR